MTAKPSLAPSRVSLKGLRIFQQIGTRLQIIERACQMASFIGFRAELGDILKNPFFPRHSQPIEIAG